MSSSPSHIISSLSALFTPINVALILIGFLLGSLLSIFAVIWHERVKKRPIPAILTFPDHEVAPLSIYSSESVYLSVVIPAYNEAQRLPQMLEETFTYLKARSSRDANFTYEIIVIDDGSRDDTCGVAFKAFQSFQDKVIENKGSFRMLKLAQNRGKGAAVTQGVLRSLGKLILFVDADGATKFSDIESLEAEITNNGAQVAIGSRSHLVKTEAVIKRSPIRNFLMYSFHTVLYILGIRTIKDTQCGFKLFTRTAAQSIFPNVHVDGWIFDIEVLLLAEMHALNIAEVSVNWHEVDGSKMSLVRDAIQMALDLLIIRLNYLFGIWEISREKSE